MAANPDFDPFQPHDLHDEIRSAIRVIAEKVIAPHTQEVDEKSRVPEEVLAALTQSGFNTTHVPEDFGGQSADRMAPGIMIEEVARVCGPSSLIQAVNNLGTMG
jgi:alkylation response protein AidB-like acyl-CoA dehydrogenase